MVMVMRRDLELVQGVVGSHGTRCGQSDFFLGLDDEGALGSHGTRLSGNNVGNEGGVAAGNHGNQKK